MASILVVDDFGPPRAFVRTVLVGEGHQVLEAENGRTALLLLKEGGIDLLICDLFMPEKDGLEVIREARRRRPGQKIIAMSGGSFGGKLDILPVAERLGAAAVLRKPFQAGDLLAAVRAALGETTFRPDAPPAPTGHGVRVQVVAAGGRGGG